MGGLKGLMVEELREGEGEDVEVMPPPPPAAEAEAEAAADDDAAALALAPPAPDMDPRGPVGMLLALVPPLLGPVGGPLPTPPPEEGETETPAAPLVLLLTELWREMPDQLFPPRPPRGAKPLPRGGGT